ncbi:MAG: type II toxin-antitoxin system ParD family antitoxin [Pseudomonadota bacterium]|nr:type II toxin-antitoxin system ParD family antitoxin [Pseudomonadota bacterium]
MSDLERVTVTMPGEMAAALRRTVDGGEYVSASEIVPEALREWSRRRDDERRDLETLREAIRVGDESGHSIPADEVFAELRRVLAGRGEARP